jgi:hypothetical protein
MEHCAKNHKPEAPSPEGREKKVTSRRHRSWNFYPPPVLVVPAYSIYQWCLLQQDKKKRKRSCRTRNSYPTSNIHQYFKKARAAKEKKNEQQNPHASTPRTLPRPTNPIISAPFDRRTGLLPTMASHPIASKHSLNNTTQTPRLPTKRTRARRNRSRTRSRRRHNDDNNISPPHILAARL